MSTLPIAMTLFVTVEPCPIVTSPADNTLARKLTSLPISTESATKNTLPPWAPFSTRIDEPLFALNVPFTRNTNVPAALSCPSITISPFSSAEFRQYTPGVNVLPVSPPFISVHGSCFSASIEFESSFVAFRPAAVRIASPFAPRISEFPRSVIPLSA